MAAPQDVQEGLDSIRESNAVIQAARDAVQDAYLAGGAVVVAQNAGMAAQEALRYSDFSDGKT